MDVLEVSSSDIKVSDRKKVFLSGVKKLISFDPEEFLIETNLGVLLLKGESLEIVKLDTVEGTISIKGKINGYNYMDNNKKDKDNGLVAKLFK